MAKITIHGKDYPMALTTRALKTIGEKFGGLNSIGTTLYNEESVEKRLDLVLSLTTLLINEAVAQHNIFEPQEAKWESISEDFLGIATTPADLMAFAPVIREALQEGMERNVESESDSKN